MIHRISLVIKNGWKNINRINELYQQIKILHSIFTKDILGQIYDNIVELEDLDKYSFKQLLEIRFNMAYVPIHNINLNIRQILKSLNYVRHHGKDCIKYNEYLKNVKKYNNGQSKKPPAPIPKPKQITSWEYWSKLDNIVFAFIVETCLHQSVVTVEGLSTADNDIITNHSSIEKFDLGLFHQSNSNLFTSKHTAIELLRKLLVFGKNDKKIHIGDFTWNANRRNHMINLINYYQNHY